MALVDTAILPFISALSMLLVIEILAVILFTVC